MRFIKTCFCQSLLARIKIKEEMDNLGREIVVLILIVSVSIWWWYTAKRSESRKYILLWGICTILAILSYIILRLWDIMFFAFMGLLALIGIIYFCIKALLSESKVKDDSSHD